jgi:hypothetical protein
LYDRAIAGIAVYAALRGIRQRRAAADIGPG